MCSHHFLSTSSTIVCVNCGLEKLNLEIDRYSVNSAPFNHGYKRLGRFKSKLDKLWGTNNGPKSHDPIWCFLEQNKRFLKGPKSVRDALRTSQLKNKFYDDIRIFCDVFTSFKVKQPSHETYQKILEDFKNIYQKWVFNDSLSFFSYTWLLRRLLKKYNTGLSIFLKPPTSKKRSKKYETLFKQLQAYDGTHYRETVGTHFQNVLPLKVIPPDLKHRSYLFRLLQSFSTRHS